MVFASRRYGKEALMMTRAREALELGKTVMVEVESKERADYLKRRFPELAHVVHFQEEGVEITEVP